MEVCDVTKFTKSAINKKNFYSNFVCTVSDKAMEFCFEEWDEDDLVERLEDDERAINPVEARGRRQRRLR